MSIYLSSGPCVKQGNWDFSLLNKNYINRSHRSDVAKIAIQDLINRQKNLLDIPSDYKLAIVPASATGAIEMLMWCLLGLRQVDVHVIDVFSKLWAHDVKTQLKIQHNVIEAKYGELTPKIHNAKNDLLLTLSATTTGAAYQNLDWIKDDRQGLVIVDATAAAFCMPIDFKKTDAVAFSWQKGLGGEAGIGVIVLSPKAIMQLEKYKPNWPIPKIMSLWNEDDSVNLPLFDGITLNTPSLLSLADLEVNLDNIDSMGGIGSWYDKGLENVNFFYNWVLSNDQLIPLANSNNQARTGSVCFMKKGFENFNDYYIHYEILKDQGIFDCVNHNRSVPSFRVWCGASVDIKNLKKFTQIFEKFL